MLYRVFLWVSWNLFLAAIPVALAYTLSDLAGPPGKAIRPLRKAVMVVLGIVWLVFLPNTCYLLTEWRHFLDELQYSNLYAVAHLDSWSMLKLAIYTVFYFCYSGIGMLAFTLAIRPMVRLAKRDGADLWVWGTVLFLLTSIGVYLGLVLRFNSWDLVTRATLIWDAAINAMTHPMLATFVILFAGVLWIAYVAVDIWVDGLICRWNAIRRRSTTTNH